MHTISPVHLVRKVLLVVVVGALVGCTLQPLNAPETVPPAATEIPEIDTAETDTTAPTVIETGVQEADVQEAGASEMPPLADELTVAGIQQHLEALSEIAQANGGTRAAGTAGYQAAVEYLVAQLRDAGYNVTVQPFTFDGFVTLSPPQLAQITPDAKVYNTGELGVMAYSGSGEITGTVAAVDVISPVGTAPDTSTSGCEAADFAGFTAGSIALMQRGTCHFHVKVANAMEAGASAAIIFNEGQAGRTGLYGGSLGEDNFDAPIPTVSTSYVVGQELLAALDDAQSGNETVTVHLQVETRGGDIETVNVLAETPGGDPDTVVMAGGHFDSVAAGPGINDNGSGTAALLEMALELAQMDEPPTNKVRFAFWGAEELGLLGSTYYVRDLQENAPEELDDIALYLNFDMIGSPNYIRAVYSIPSAPDGSAEIEAQFTDYFDAQGLGWETTSIAGRSDHAAFMRARIPVGGLFSGAENIMRPSGADLYPHAEVGEPTDPCYHRACDTLDNVNPTALDELGDAAAHVLQFYAQDETLGERWD